MLAISSTGRCQSTESGSGIPNRVRGQLISGIPSTGEVNESVIYLIQE